MQGPFEVLFLRQSQNCVQKLCPSTTAAALCCQASWSLSQCCTALACDTKCDRSAACMKLGSKPPRTCCSILCNLSSVTRARGAAQCTNASRQGRAAILRFNLLGRDGKAGAVHRRGGGSSWRGGGRPRAAGREASREATSLCNRSQGGRRSGPPAVQTDVSSKATNRAVSRGFPYKKLEVGTSHRL